MSLLTRCPACSTLYKVVPDQLRISQGWVKCGQCGEIFDASQHLLEAATEDEVPGEPQPEPPVEPPAEQPLAPPDLPQPVAPVAEDAGQALPSAAPPFTPSDITNAPTAAVDPDSDLCEPAQAVPDPELALDLDLWQAAQPDLGSAAALPSPSPVRPLPADDDLPVATGPPVADAAKAGEDAERDEVHERVALIWPPMPTDVSPARPAALDADAAVAEPAGPETPQPLALADEPCLAGPLPAQPAVDHNADQAQRALRDQEPDTQAPSFMRDAGRQSVWQRPGVRAGVSLLALLLALGLVGQWVVQARDRLAAAQPNMVPALQRLCQWVGCELAPLQQIESIAIDAAAFSKTQTDHYRLSFTLKNSAPLALAWPSIELTLTDAQDQPVIRRVLSPQELGAPAAQLAAASEQALSVQLQVTPPAASPPAVGYRLLAFYP